MNSYAILGHICNLWLTNLFNYEFIVILICTLKRNISFKRNNVEFINKMLGYLYIYDQL